MNILYRERHQLAVNIEKIEDRLLFIKIISMTMYIFLIIMGAIFIILTGKLKKIIMSVTINVTWNLMFHIHLLRSGL